MKDLLKKEKTILEVIADIYIFTMILVFPLIVDKTGFLFDDSNNIYWYKYSCNHLFFNI